MNSPYWEHEVRCTARVLGISDEKDFYTISGVVENLRVENKSLKAELAEANKKLIEQDRKIMEQLRKASPMFENQNPIKPDNRLLDADGSGNLLPETGTESNPGQILANAIQVDNSGGRPNWHLAQHIFDAAEVIVSFGDVDEAADAITNAISKATEELKTENQRLNNKITEMLFKLGQCFSFKPENFEELICEITKTQSELIQAQAQVAGLIDAANRVLRGDACPFCDGIRYRREDGYHWDGCATFDLQQAAKNTQATADAYTARLRAKERAKTIEECLEVVKNEKAKVTQQLLPESTKYNIRLTFDICLEALRNLKGGE